VKYGQRAIHWDGLETCYSGWQVVLGVHVSPFDSASVMKSGMGQRRATDPNRFRGLEVCEITPVIVVGDPVSEQIALTREQHIE
jgi:hypothetical protein